MKGIILDILGKLSKERENSEEQIKNLQNKIDMLNDSEKQEISDKEVKEKAKNFLKAKFINKEILFDIVNRIEIDENKNIYIYFNFKQLNIYNDEEIFDVSIS